MALTLAFLLAAHGLIHLLGFARAFGVANVPQLQSISPLFGSLWLAAACLFLVAAAALFVWPRGWWAIGAGAVLVSTVVIVPAWSDAKFGMLANVLVLVAVVVGFLLQGPSSLRAEYDGDVDRALERGAPAAPITEADLAPLPDPVQRYLRASGVVGRPRVRNFRVRMHGRIRSGRGARWLPLTAEQHNFVSPAARFFYLNGTMFAIPVQGYHRYLGPSATMRVKLAGLVTLADVAGEAMKQGETVTLFNDMCVMAPATLVDAAIIWEPVDAQTVRATFTNAGQTIRAELSFTEAGELSNFSSADRYKLAADGATVERVRWSTPLRRYRSFDGVSLASGGEGRWHDTDGEYVYIELTFDEVRYNVHSRWSRTPTALERRQR
jgi:hypothetical protein